MKHHFYFFRMAIVGLFMAVAFNSCDDDENNGGETTLSVSPESISATAGAGSYTITVTSNAAWTAESNAAWCTLSPASAEGNGTVTLNAAANTAQEQRTATVTVKAGSLTETVHVTQAAATGQPDPEIGNTLVVTVENGNSLNGKIDEVKGEVYDYDMDHIYIVTNAPYRNGGFTLELPGNPDAQLLDPFEDLPASLTVSDANVKTMVVFLNAYKSGNSVGRFYHGTADWKGDIMWYVDRDVSITGTNTDDEGTTYKYNVHLKQGWNIMYYMEKENNTVECTTTVPAGAKWHFGEYASDDEPAEPEPASSQYGKASALSLKRNH
jgi:hypothetical protein